MSLIFPNQLSREEILKQNQSSNHQKCVKEVALIDFCGKHSQPQKSIPNS